MLHPTTKPLLHNAKNLLAFSAGGDSTALFFLLLEANISFDIAIVDYGMRTQSKEEVAYAQALANRYNLACYLHQAPKIEKNFEAHAREIRYTFFEQLIEQHHYDNLLTAHHLGDRFEWALMQFCKGAGCVEFAGMEYIQTRNNYKLIRPLLHLDKEDLLNYLHQNDIRYFQDQTNQELRYTRNSFRHLYTQPLLQKYKKGIAKSFEYIDKDKALLVQEVDVSRYKALAYFQNTTPRNTIYTVDKYLKSQNKLLTHHERELLTQHATVVIGREFVVSQHTNYTFIAPYLPYNNQTKQFKEKMRKLKIDPKLRGYLASDEEVEAFLSRLLA
jgi:tRNA(Ile)-lysidine synthase